MNGIRSEWDYLIGLLIDIETNQTGIIGIESWFRPVPLYVEIESGRIEMNQNKTG